MPKRKFIVGLSLAIGTIVSFCAVVKAEDVAIPQSPNAKPVRGIVRVYSQIVSYAVPAGFVGAYTNDSGTHFILEQVPEGETVNKWTQMITVTGDSGAVSYPGLTNEMFYESIAKNFRRDCPHSYSSNVLSHEKVGDHDMLVAVVGCGTAYPTGEQYSEEALVIVIHGKEDYYSIQWAERSKASPAPLPLDRTKWGDRLKRLKPIELIPAN
jgi:hypothetical protein